MMSLNLFLKAWTWPLCSQSWGGCKLYNKMKSSCLPPRTPHLTFPPLCSPQRQLPRPQTAFFVSTWKSRNLGQLIQVESVILLS
jgi:hypothetical protein